MSDSQSADQEETGEPGIATRYWRANLALLLKLLAVWFAASFGAGILFADALNAIEIFGFKLGFWFAQQGSIFVFVILIFVYAHRIGKIERKFGLSDEGEPDSYDLMDGGDGNRAP